ncbi:short-chain dehydrogenase [Alteromonas australica]|nr:short-chain dehydrogenase [Alteromonas australica]
MSISEKVPTPQEFLIETPLYEIASYEDADLEQGRLLRYFDETFDSYCPQCNSHSIFERYWQSSKFKEYDPSSWIDCGVFSIQIQCTRDRRHKQLFIFEAIGQTIQKIGQLPSIAELNLFDVKKYSKVLEQKYFRELTKAIGLASHGVGVGSFVYLRRIFEFLIEESHLILKEGSAWDEETYKRARMNEKIEMLSAELPEFLVENKSMYSILSKGIHELSENECLKAFPIVKVGIEIILDEKIEKLNKEKKLAEAKKALSSLGSSI